MMINIVIPSYQGLHFLQKLIPGLVEHTKDLDRQITVIDNGSNDGTIEWLQTQPVVLIQNGTNLGFAKANNLAARSVDSQYTLFLNQDIVTTPDFLHHMLRLIGHRDVAAVGAQLIQEGTNKIHHAGITFLTDGPNIGMPVEYCRDARVGDGRSLQDRCFLAVTAACMLIKTEVFLYLGGFCEDYVNGWEDNDLCCRLTEQGWQIKYSAKSILYHVVESSLGRHAKEEQNRELFRQRWVVSGKITKHLQRAENR